MNKKDKIFKDPIYGYVTIPYSYCLDFIDSEIFQRLRRIEQTSMRVLYPSARHDRFAHSLGVYHLGTLAFKNLKRNSSSFFPSISKDQWESYQKTFELACLMHDCGHSPFSHTFEHFYLFHKEDIIKNLLADYYKEDTNFVDDFCSSAPAPHEKISALVLLEHFKSKMLSNGASPELAARMIMGCRYENDTNTERKFENKLISILNGSGIDVDSLDYIQRDSWASGVSNVEIDYHRLLSALMIKPDKDKIPQIVFKKNVLSVLDNIGIGRNFLYKWIYSHHIVNYEQYLLKKIIDKINSDSGEEFCNKVFSLESFKTEQNFQSHTYYLPSDDDIVYTIKNFRDTDPKINEFLSRKYIFKALWKTYFEFNDAHFSSVSLKNRMSIVTKINKNALNNKYGEGKFLCLQATPKLKGINKNDYFIEIDDKMIDASAATSLTNANLDYFILYVVDDLLSKKKQILKDVLSLQS